MMSKKITSLLILLLMLPTPCFGQGKISYVKKGQTAPFDGILMDKEAEATITAKRESAVKICEIEKDYETKKIKSECEFNKRLMAIEKEADQKKYNSLMALKNAEIKRLEDSLKKTDKTDYTRWWFAGGILAGIGLSVGIFKIAVEIRQ